MPSLAMRRSIFVSIAAKIDEHGGAHKRMYEAASSVSIDRTVICNAASSSDHIFLRYPFLVRHLQFHSGIFLFSFR